MLATQAMRQLRTAPNIVAMGVTVAAAMAVFLWAQRPLTSVTTFHADAGRGLSVRQPVAFSGFGDPDDHGRWTVEDEATVSFGRPLPRQFVAVLHGRAHGPNVRAPIQICAGGDCEDVVFSASDADVRVALTPRSTARRLELRIPHPTAPGGGDDRLLGVALVFVRIEVAG